MSGMFRDSQFDKDISNWNVSNVTQHNGFATRSNLAPENQPTFNS